MTLVPRLVGRRIDGLPNGLEMSRPASAQIVARIRFAAAGRVGSIELFGGGMTVLLGEGIQELVSFDRRLGKDRPEGGGLERSVVGHGKGCASAVGVGSLHRNVVGFSHENETEPFEGSDDVANGRIDGELGHLGGQLSLGHKGLDNRLTRVNNLGAETLDVELDGRSHIGKCKLVGVTFSDHYALESEWVGDVAVRMLLNDYFELSCHGHLLAH